MKNASAAWTAQIAARAGNVNREILGEELPVNGDEVTSLGIRRQLRHARYLERKDARQTMSVVSMHTNSPVPIQGLGHTRGVSNTPHLFPRPPTADSKSNFYSTKVANAKKNAWKCTCGKPFHAEGCQLLPLQWGKRRWEGANVGVTEDDLAFYRKRRKLHHRM